MTVVLSAKIPTDLTAEEAVRKALSLFSAEDNRKYFDNLKSGKSTDGIRESFFALTILAQAAEMLPRRVDASKLIIKKTDSGKPYFEGENIYFSITHSKDCIACAVSDSEEVGIDMECTDISEEKAKKLANRFFCESEVLDVNKNPEKFKKLWCQQEAATKYLGTDLSSYLKEQKSGNNKEEYFFQTLIWERNPIILCSKRKISTILFKINQ